MATVQPLAEEIPELSAGGKILPGKDHPVCVSLLCFHHEFNPARLHAAALGPASCRHRREGRRLLLQPVHFPDPAHCHRHTQMPAQGEGGIASLSDSINLQYRIVQFTSLSV